MNLRPEQERALSYARRRGTEAPLDEIRSRVASTFSEFEALVAPLPPDVARTRPSPSAWSVQEVIDHLVVSDTLALDQLTQLLRNESSDTPIPASLQSPHPLDTEWPSLLSKFTPLHQQILAVLYGASDGIPLSATAPVEMVVKCTSDDGQIAPVHWIQRFDWKAFAILLHAHNREHIAQVQRTLGSLADHGKGGEPPGS
jgi:DinB superfamily